MVVESRFRQGLVLAQPVGDSVEAKDEILMQERIVMVEPDPDDSDGGVR